MSFTRPARTDQELTRPGLARPRLVTPGRIAFAAIAIGLLAACATLLSQRAIPTQPVATTLTLAASQNDLPPGQSPPSAGVDLQALTVEAAHRQLAAATEQLAQFESSLQGQLAELKSRQDDTDQAARAQQAIAASATSCYQAAARIEHERQLTQTLEAAQIDPLAWSRVPADELEPYTELRQLLTELRTAQTRTAHLLKTRLPAHPAVQSARAAEQELAEGLQQELAEVLPQQIAAVKASEQQLASLRDELQRRETHERQLAALAAEHDRYLGNVRTCEAVLRQAEQTVSAAHNTDEHPSAAAIEIDNIGSQPASIPRPAGASPLPATQPATDSTLVSGNRLLLLLGGLCGGLFACMGYFYLTGSRSVAPNIAQASRAGHEAPPTNPNAEASPAAMRPNPSDTVCAPTATSSLNEPPHSTASPIRAHSTSPAPATTSMPPRSVTRDPLGLQPTGRMTLRDALVRCADRANRP